MSWIEDVTVLKSLQTVFTTLIHFGVEGKYLQMVIGAYGKNWDVVSRKIHSNTKMITQTLKNKDTFKYTKPEEKIKNNHRETT